MGTLEHYPQEVAAVAALDSASEDSKLLIRFALQLLDTARDVATAVFDPSAAPNAAAAFSFAVWFS